LPATGTELITVYQLKTEIRFDLAIAGNKSIEFDGLSYGSVDRYASGRVKAAKFDGVSHAAHT
jgi:hypothetical protein